MTGGKKILVVLTNESFLPHEGHGSPSYTQSTQSGTPYAPSSWQSPVTTTYAPPANKPVVTDEFNTKHRPTGVNILEVGHLWFKMARSERWDLTFATPCGGAVAIDPLSIRALDRETADKIWHETELMSKLNHTYPLAWINPKDYDAVVIPGSHAAMLDLPECPRVRTTIAAVWRESGCVAAIGHGVAALLNVKEDSCGRTGNGAGSDSDGSSDSSGSDGDGAGDGQDGGGKTGHYLIEGKKIACYTTEEEEKNQLAKFLPFSLEERVRKRGGKVQKRRPFESNVVTEQCGHKVLITAQSHPSVHEFIDKIHEFLCRKH